MTAPTDPLAGFRDRFVIRDPDLVYFDGNSLGHPPRSAAPAVVWDVSHAVGAIPLALDAWDLDVAVGCTYKYLHGGPGAPGFVSLGPGAGGAELRHPGASRIVRAGRAAKVIADFRPPDILRLGPGPLTCGFAEAEEGIARLAEVVGSLNLRQ